MYAHGINQLIEYQCDLCGAIFHRKILLAKHLSSRILNKTKELLRKISVQAEIALLLEKADLGRIKTKNTETKMLTDAPVVFLNASETHIVIKSLTETETFLITEIKEESLMIPTDMIKIKDEFVEEEYQLQESTFPVCLKEEVSVDDSQDYQNFKNTFVIKAEDTFKDCPEELIIKVTHKQLVCNICFQNCNLPKDLKTHILFKHNVKMTFDCDKCEFISGTRMGLFYHNVKHKSTIIEPQKVWRYPCLFCNKGFMYSGQVKEHMRNIHGGSLKCTLCSKMFDLKSKLTTHLQKEHPRKKKLRKFDL